MKGAKARHLSGRVGGGSVSTQQHHHRVEPLARREYTAYDARRYPTDKGYASVGCFRCPDCFLWTLPGR